MSNCANEWDKTHEVFVVALFNRERFVREFNDVLNEENCDVR